MFNSQSVEIESIQYLSTESYGMQLGDFGIRLQM